MTQLAIIGGTGLTQLNDLVIRYPLRRTVRRLYHGRIKRQVGYFSGATR